MIVLVLVGLGLVCGSFVNALVWRLYKQEELKSSADELAVKKRKESSANTSQLTDKDLSIVKGRSMCSYCHHELAVQDLIPVVSWLMLRGKCRYCRHPIEDSPAIELVTAILFLVSYFWWPLSFDAAGIFAFVLWLVFVTAFVALAVYDIRWFLLPDRIVFPLIFLVAGKVIVDATIFDGGWQTVLEAIWGMLIISGLFFLIYVVSKGGWIGFGDVKLAIVLGLLVGGPLNALLLIFVASLLGSLLALPLVLEGRARVTTHLPFGPFLLAATAIVVLMGDHITDWYTNLLTLP